MWKAHASGRKSSFLNRYKFYETMISCLYNIIFIRSVSMCDRLQNMVLRISQHCTPCIHNWFLFPALDHQSYGCRQSNAFGRRWSFLPLMESVVLLCVQTSQLMACLDCPISERRIFPKAPELLPVESQKEQSFYQFAVGIVRKHWRARYQVNGKRIFCTTSMICGETRKRTFACQIYRQASYFGCSLGQKWVLEFDGPFDSLLSQ